jgi:hypothetical protein
MRSVRPLGVAVLLAVLASSEARANGRRPPQTLDAAPLTVVCRERSSGQDTTMLRAQVANGDQVGDTLLIRRDGRTEEVPIRDIRSLAIDPPTPDAEGFAKATLDQGAEKRPVEVQVRKGDKNVRLQGFSSSGQRTAVDLDHCKSIQIEAAKSVDDMGSHRGGETAD